MNVKTVGLKPKQRRLRRADLVGKQCGNVSRTYKLVIQVLRPTNPLLLQTKTTLFAPHALHNIRDGTDIISKVHSSFEILELNEVDQRPFNQELQVLP